MLNDLNRELIDEIEDFFVAYNKERGKLFKPLGRHGPKRAMKLVKQGMTAFRRNQKNGDEDSDK